LVASDDLGVMARERLGKQAAGVPSDPVVTSQWIAVSNYKSPASRVWCSKLETGNWKFGQLSGEFRVSSFEFRISSPYPGFAH
jgi:hypothetical protein